MDPRPVPAPPLWASSAAKAVRLTVWVRGTVQGVGFRWWTRCRGLELGLVGTAGSLRPAAGVAGGGALGQGPPGRRDGGDVPLVGAVGCVQGLPGTVTGRGH